MSCGSARFFKYLAISVAGVAVVTTCIVLGCLDTEKKSFKNGELVQVFHYGGPGNDKALAITPLDDGGFVMAGIHGGGEVFEGMDFGDPIGDPDAFVARIDRLGNPVWVVNIVVTIDNGGLDRIHPNFVAIDGGDTAMVGVKADGRAVSIELWGSGIAEEFVLEYQPEEAVSERLMGALVLAFDLSDGELRWKSLNGPGCIMAGASGAETVYVAAVEEDNTKIYLEVDLESEETSHGDQVIFPDGLGCTGSLGSHQFIAAYSTDDGGLCWAVPVVGCSKGFGLAFDDPYVALAGRFENTVGFVTNPEGPSDTDTDLNWSCNDPDAGAVWECQEVSSIEGTMDAFVARLDASLDATGGTAGWVRRLGGGSGDDAGYGVTFTPDGVAVAGTFESRAEICHDEECDAATVLETTSGEAGLFLAKYSVAGELLWATHAEVDLAPDDAHFKEFDLTATENGGLVVVGGFRGTATFEPEGPGTVVLESFNGAGEPEPFVARYNPDGTLRWARSECGQNAQGALHSVAPVVLAGEQIFLAAGGFVGTAVFGAEEAKQTTLVSEDALPGDQDIFVVQLRDE